MAPLLVQLPSTQVNYFCIYITPTPFASHGRSSTKALPPTQINFYCLTLALVPLLDLLGLTMAAHVPSLTLPLLLHLSTTPVAKVSLLFIVFSSSKPSRTICFQVNPVQIFYFVCLLQMMQILISSCLFRSIPRNLNYARFDLPLVQMIKDKESPLELDSYLSTLIESPHFEPPLAKTIQGKSHLEIGLVCLHCLNHHLLSLLKSR